MKFIFVGYQKRTLLVQIDFCRILVGLHLLSMCGRSRYPRLHLVSLVCPCCLITADVPTTSVTTLATYRRECSNICRYVTLYCSHRVKYVPCFPCLKAWLEMSAYVELMHGLAGRGVMELNGQNIHLNHY